MKFATSFLLIFSALVFAPAYGEENCYKSTPILPTPSDSPQESHKNNNERNLAAIIIISGVIYYVIKREETVIHFKARDTI